MKKVIQLALACALVLAACKKTETATPQSVKKSSATPGPFAAISPENAAATNYCVSKGTHTSRGYIEKVSMETINNQSGNNGGYADFTSQSANLYKTATYTIGLTPGFVSGAAYFEYWTVYIDYNQDGVFEPNELVAKGNAAIRINKSFTIPATATNGPTRMRIQMQDGALETDPCAIFTYGEVEDYTVNILPALK